MPEAIPPVGASWDQEGAFYGQDACLAPTRKRICIERNFSGLIYQSA
jgi:hypothetical protein